MRVERIHGYIHSFRCAWPRFICHPIFGDFLLLPQCFTIHNLHASVSRHGINATITSMTPGCVQIVNVFVFLAVEGTNCVLKMKHN